MPPLPHRGARCHAQPGGADADARAAWRDRESARLGQRHKRRRGQRHGRGRSRGSGRSGGERSRCFGRPTGRRRRPRRHAARRGRRDSGRRGRVAAQPRVVACASRPSSRRVGRPGAPARDPPRGSTFRFHTRDAQARDQAHRKGASRLDDNSAAPDRLERPPRQCAGRRDTRDQGDREGQRLGQRDPDLRATRPRQSAVHDRQELVRHEPE